MGVLDGKTAVITGGTRGLGLAIARAYVQAGAAVVVASRSPAGVHAAVDALRAAGGRAEGASVDVADLAQVEGLAALALKRFGRLDIWVNNAGIAGPFGPTLATTPDVFRAVVDTNILGVYYGSRVALQHFTAQRSGKLINLLGRGHDAPVAWQNAYAASKAWVASFTKALAEETKDSGAGVYAFNPGMVLTDLLTSVEVIAGSEPRLKAFPTVIRMWARPPEAAARKAVWLASSATDGKTGLRVSMLTAPMLAGGALQEGLRALFRRPAPPVDLRIRTIAPDEPAGRS